MGLFTVSVCVSACNIASKWYHWYYSHALSNAKHQRLTVNGPRCLNGVAKSTKFLCPILKVYKSLKRLLFADNEIMLVLEIASWKIFVFLCSLYNGDLNWCDDSCVSFMARKQEQHWRRKVVLSHTLVLLKNTKLKKF